MNFFASAARDAGKKTAWVEQHRTVPFTNYATLSAGRFGVMKTQLGSRGFRGISSITIEVDPPYRVSVIDRGIIYESKLSKDSNLLLAIKVLWQTTRSMKKNLNSKMLDSSHDDAIQLTPVPTPKLTRIFSVAKS